MLLRIKHKLSSLSKPSIAFFLELYSRAKIEIFFVQAGAYSANINDPIFRYIILNQWKGLLIEPQTNHFKILRQTYRHCQGLIFENVALSDKNGKQDFYFIEKADKLPNWIGQLSSFRREVPASILSQFPEASILSKSITCITLNDILKKHQIKHIDLLMLDIEGYDALILEDLNFIQHEPELILYEHCHLLPQEKQNLTQLLEQKNYILFEEGFNTLAIGPNAPADFKNNSLSFL